MYYVIHPIFPTFPEFATLGEAIDFATDEGTDPFPADTSICTLDDNGWVEVWVPTPR